MAGRIWTGTAQLLLFVVAFGLVLAWFGLTLREAYRQVDMSNSAPAQSHAVLGIAGAILAAAVWLWSLVTSLVLLQQAEKQDQPPRSGAPPRIPGEQGGTQGSPD